MADIDFTDIERMVRKKREEDASKVRAAYAVTDEENESVGISEEPNETQNSSDEPDDVPEHTEKEVKSERRLPAAPEEPEADTMSPTVEMSPAGAHSTTEYKGDAVPDMELPKRKPTVQSKPAAKPKSRRQRSEVVYLRDMPKSIVGEARRIFPTAGNNTDAVAVYIAYKSGVRDGLTDAQVELLDTTEVADPVVEQNQRLSHMERTMTNMVSMMQELEMAVSYMIFDRLGFRRENPDAPRQANMNEPGMTEMIERVREMGRQMRQQENRRKGRPIR